MYHSMNELKKIKLSFYTIPGVVTRRVKMKDVILDVAYKFHGVSVCVFLNYVAVIIRISQYAGDSSLLNLQVVLGQRISK